MQYEALYIWKAFCHERNINTDVGYCAFYTTCIAVKEIYNGVRGIEKCCARKCQNIIIDYIKCKKKSICVIIRMAIYFYIMYYKYLIESL